MTIVNDIPETRNPAAANGRAIRKDQQHVYHSNLKLDFKIFDASAVLGDGR